LGEERMLLLAHWLSWATVGTGCPDARIMLGLDRGASIY
jgi:hypothetical protein